MIFVLALLACTGEPEAPPVEPVDPLDAEAPSVVAPPVEITFTESELAVFQPALPPAMEAETNPISDEKVALGRMLYYDGRLSKNHDVSCNSCHALDRWGVDGAPTSSGHLGQKGGRNAPTVYHAAAHDTQFWDGRAADVEAQAKGPVLNPIEMAMPSEAAVVAVLRSIPGYAPAFQAAFPGEKDPITYDNLARAIGAFERKLVTPSRFDAFLGGDTAALTDEEKKGLKTFLATGCQACHNGVLVGGKGFQKAGLVKPWPNEADPGRYVVTQDESDRMMFKVPSLRNIAKTGPYFHDGSVLSLEQAVMMMADHQLGKQLTPEEVSSIAAFLGSLTGEIPADYIAAPTLPESGPKTPPPDPS